MYRIFISRPQRVTMMTLTYAGHHPWTQQTAYVRCTCGWSDKTFADRVTTLAKGHAERHTFVGQRVDIHPEVLDHEPAEGVTRCACGSKYWDGDRCHSCGERWRP